MTDFLKQTLNDIEKRLRELEPAVEEHRQLQEAAAALRGVDGSAASPATPSTRSMRRRRSSSSSASTSGGSGRRGRPRGSGKRAQQALALVNSRPGITIPELAKEMKIQPNYLYRVLPGLEQDGKVSKKDKGWYPAA